VQRILALAIAVTFVAARAGAADAIQISTAARAIAPGEVVLFTARTEEPLDTLQVRAFDRTIATYRLDARTWQSVLGIDLDVVPGSYVVFFDGVARDQAIKGTTTVTVKRRVFRTRTLRVDDAFVNPPPPVIARITGEAAELERLWTDSAPDRLWVESFLRPVPGQANSAFGTRSVFNGQPRQPHGGADFLSPSGTPVLAPNSGRVVLARDLYFTGNTVVIDHGLGIFSLLAHLSVMNVREGTVVTRGDTIGEVGATGRVTGPHLHWAVRMNGARVDPLAVLATLSPREFLSPR